MWEHKCATLFCAAANQVKELPEFLNRETEEGWELFQLEPGETQHNKNGAWVTRLAVFRRMTSSEPESSDGKGAGEKKLLMS